MTPILYSPFGSSLARHSSRGEPLEGDKTFKKKPKHALQITQNSTDARIFRFSNALKERRGSEREEKSRYPKIQTAFCLARACIWILPGHASGLLRGAALASSFCFICSISALPGLTKHEEEAVQRVYRENLPDSSCGYVCAEARSEPPKYKVMHVPGGCVCARALVFVSGGN